VTRRPAPARALRGALLAVSSTTLAVTAHGVAGGGWPEMLPVLPLSVLLAYVGVSLAERWRSRWTVVGVLAATELAQHVLLSVIHGGSMFPPGLMTAAHLVSLLLTAVLVAKADAAVVAVAAAVRRFLPVLPSFAFPDRLSAPVPVWPVSHVLDVLLRRSQCRRGPPILS
jgi:hypothetical protein